MQRKHFTFICNSKQFINLPFYREKFVLKGNFLKGLLSTSPYVDSYNSIKNIFKYRRSFYKNNTNFSYFSLDYKSYLSFFLERQKGKKRQLKTGYFSLGNLVSFSTKSTLGLHFRTSIVTFDMPHKIQSSFFVSNFRNLKTMKKALSSLYGFPKICEKFIYSYPSLKGKVEVISPLYTPLKWVVCITPVKGNNTQKYDESFAIAFSPYSLFAKCRLFLIGGAHGNYTDKKQNTFAVVKNNLALERIINRLSGVYQPFNFKGLDGLSGNNITFKDQDKQDYKQVLNKIFFFLKEETLKKSYQTPAVVITKVNQQLRNIYYLKMPYKALKGNYAYPSSLDLLTLECRGLKPPKSHPLEQRSGWIKPFMGLGAQVPSKEGTFKTSYPYSYSQWLPYRVREINRELRVFKSATLTLMNKSIKKLIWAMLKKQYSNLSKSFIASKNWFFLLVKKLIKNDLLNMQESNALPYQKHSYFQQRSYFFSLSLVPFSSISFQKERSYLILLNKSFFSGSKKQIICKEIEPYFFSTCDYFYLGFAYSTEFSDFKWFFNLMRISPMQTLFKRTVKAAVNFNIIDLAFLLFLKRNLYNTYTFMYTSVELKIKSASAPLTLMSQDPFGFSDKNKISKDYLIGITHYLASFKRKQSVLKMSYFFQQLKIVSDSLVVSNLYSLEAFLFLFPTNGRQFKVPVEHWHLCPIRLLADEVKVPSYPSRPLVLSFMISTGQACGNHKGCYSIHFEMDRIWWMRCRGLKPPTSKEGAYASTSSIELVEGKDLNFGISLNKKETRNITTNKFKKVSSFYQNNSNKLKLSKKQKLFSIWKNQNRVTSFCYYSF